MFPAPNPAVLAEIAGADAVVYAMGSLYTSICPSLVLQVPGWNGSRDPGNPCVHDPLQVLDEQD